MRIIISGPAFASEGESIQIVDPDLLRTMDGLESGEGPCAEYLDGPLGELDIQGGTLRIVFDPSSASLRVVTEYVSPRKLKKAELAELVEFTKAHWSDGIGESGFDAYQEQTGIFITVSTVPYDDTLLQIQQINDGSSVPGRSPLLIAAQRGDLKKIKTLLEGGEDLESVDRWGCTPLMCAVAENQEKAAALLISRGADVNHRADSGATSIRLAAMSDHAGILSAHPGCGCQSGRA